MAKYAKLQDNISGQRLEVGASNLQVDIPLYMASIGRDVSTLDYLIRDARRNQFIFPKFLCVAPFPPVSFVFFSEKVLCVGNWILSRL